MNGRLTLLLGLLLLAVLVSAPAYVLDRATETLEAQLSEAERDLDHFRRTQARASEAEAALAEYARRAAELEQRLLSADPFRDIYRELTAVAAQSGVVVLPLEIGGAERVEGLPALVRYPVHVRVSGTAPGFIQFMERLEEHPLLIEIPDLDLALADGTALTDDLNLSFFGRAAGAPLAEPEPKR